MLEIKDLKFDDKGLIPAIVVDALSKKVLTLAYMNKESLEISIKEGKTCFWSRSRQELWRTGETSGNYQHIQSITADCDKDALVVVVEKAVKKERQLRKIIQKSIFFVFDYFGNLIFFGTKSNKIKFIKYDKTLHNKIFLNVIQIGSELKTLPIK